MVQFASNRRWLGGALALLAVVAAHPTAADPFLFGSKKTSAPAPVPGRKLRTA